MNPNVLDVFTAGVSNGEFGLPEEAVVVMERGQGYKLWTTDGKEFLDYSMGWGSCLVGHAHPKVVSAVAEQIGKGSNFSYLNDKVLELAQQIKALSPAVERIRFCASGTEATMYCQRLARAFTGKGKVLKFEGAYHGANETGVTSLFASGNTPFPTPELTSAGVEHVANNLLVAPYNDLATTQQIIEQHAGEIAAVIMEPLQRCTPPRPGFLEGVRALTQQHGVLLIFDEVVTGFRLAYGGAQEYYGVVPDLVAYGKALGGGYPIGAFGGRQDIMEWTHEHRIGGDDYVWMASTLGGNPISSCAALAALEIFREPDRYTDLHQRGQQFRAQLATLMEEADIEAQIIGDGPLAQVAFCSHDVYNHRTTNSADKVLGRKMMMGLFERGIFLNPMGTKLYLSIMHDDAALAGFYQRLRDTLKAIR